MGLLSKVFSNARKPEGLLGRMMMAAVAGHTGLGPSVQRRKAEGLGGSR